jgi:hypothetical protein
LYEIHDVTIRARDKDNATSLARAEIMKQYKDKQIDGWIIKKVEKI